MTDEATQSNDAGSGYCDLCSSGLVSRKGRVAAPDFSSAADIAGPASRAFLDARPLLQEGAQDQCLALFAVQGDVPFEHAFSELSVMLGCIRHLTTEAEMENDRQAGSAARILSGLAKALIDDMELGLRKALVSRK